MTAALVLTGFTASGKSAAAVHVALELGLEIVNLDSRQVYRGLDVGTATPDAQALAAVPHHLYDSVSPGERWSLGQHLAAVGDASAESHGRGRGVLLVGGPSLYMEAVARGYAPHAPSALRAELEHRLATEGLPALTEELERRDPVSAAAINLGNPRRVIRALEVALAGGSIVGDRRQVGEGPPVLVLGVDDDVLRQRIGERTAAMLEGGMVEEARRLMQGFGPDAPAWSAIGYRDAWSLATGRARTMDVQAAIDSATWNLVRRQRSWLRRLGTVTTVTGEGDLLAAARRTLHSVQGR